MLTINVSSIQEGEFQEVSILQDTEFVGDKFLNIEINSVQMSYGKVVVLLCSFLFTKVCRILKLISA